MPSACKRSGLIDPERVLAVETGACPHTAIREDPTLNIQAADELEAKFGPLDLVLIESGGDNLASTFSLDLVDYWLFVIDVAGGDDIPRKRGLGIVQCDLLVINKIDLAPYVRVDLERMVREGNAGAGRQADPAHQLPHRRGRGRGGRAHRRRRAVREVAAMRRTRDAVSPTVSQPSRRLWRGADDAETGSCRMTSAR